MKLNKAGVDLVKRFEGCKLHAYPDPSTGGEPWTIGWGHTGKDVTKDTVWTQKQADDRLLLDLIGTTLQVSKLLKPTISDNALSALVCFAYNVGVHNLAASTLLHLVNASNSPWAALEFEKWNHANGKVLPGLTARRKAEKELFLS